MSNKENKQDNKELFDKIKYGVSLAYHRLIQQKKQEDGELVYSIDGKIVHIRARDIKE